MTTTTTPAENILQILDDHDHGDDNSTWGQMTRLIDGMSHAERSLLSDRLWEVYEDILPKNVAFDEAAKDELIGAITAIFCGGLTTGVEFVRRGCQLP